MIIIEFKKIEEGIIPIYENESKERLINARELFYALRGEDIDFPGKGGNADNTGTEDINDILDL